jgi:signal transduction histidine kinase
MPRGKGVILWGRASALYDAEGNVIGAIESIRDVTERRRLQDSLNAVNRRLHLLASITRHDIINKVTACLGYTALLKKRTKDAAVLDLAGRLERVVSDIRNQAEFTRVYQEVGVKAPAWQDIGAILAGCSAAAVAVAPFPGRLEVFADPMLPKVFANLVENTVRHGQRATRVTVRAEETEGDGLAIVYEDDGAGVPAEEKELIFERGYGKNTGLGLFLAREILGITGISIRETGQPGAGSRFEILVPKGMFRMEGTSPRNEGRAG